MRSRRGIDYWRIALSSFATVAVVIGGVVYARHIFAKSEETLGHDAAQSQPAQGFPLFFEPNVGQTDRSVRYLSHTPRCSLFLNGDSAVISLVGGSALPHQPASRDFAALKSETPALVQGAVRIRFAGAKADAEIVGEERLLGRVNYLIGADPSKWHRDIPTYARVRATDLYPGIDLVYYGTRIHSNTISLRRRAQTPRRSRW